MSGGGGRWLGGGEEVRLEVPESNLRMVLVDQVVCVLGIGLERLKRRFGNTYNICVIIIFFGMHIFIYRYQIF